MTEAPALQIGEIVPDELPRVFELLWNFKMEARLPGSLGLDIATESWARIIGSGAGTIIALRAGGVIGALGAMIFPDLYDGRLVAQEMFWYVDRDSRGRGHLLLRAFEEWARVRGAERMLIAHMHALMPERLGTLYQRMGFQKLETNYVKCLSQPALPR